MERGSTISHCVGNWLWKSLWKCRQTVEWMNGWMNEWMNAEDSRDVNRLQLFLLKQLQLRRMGKSKFLLITEPNFPSLYWDIVRMCGNGGVYRGQHYFWNITLVSPYFSLRASFRQEWNMSNTFFHCFTMHFNSLYIMVQTMQLFVIKH
jgi:hypothetical protein